MQQAYVRMAASGATGLASGVADQFLQNMDDTKRAKAAATTDPKTGKPGTVSFFKYPGNWLNYGGGLAAILLAALGVLKGDNETRAIVAGSQLIGRKAVSEATRKNWTVTPPAKAPSPLTQGAYERYQAMEAAAAGRGNPPPQVEGSRLEF